MTTLYLPDTPKVATDAAQAITDIDQARQHLAQLGVVTQVQGSMQTLGFWWVAAHEAFPNARFVLSDEKPAAPQQAALQAAKPVEPAAPPKAAEASVATQAKPQVQPKEAKPQAEPKETKPKAASTNDSPNQWPDELFKAYVWRQGDGDKQFVEYQEKVQHLRAEYPNLSYELEQSRAQARHALNMESALQKRIAKGWSEEELSDWIKELSNNKQIKWRVKRHLNIKLKNHFEFRRNKNKLAKKHPTFKPSIPYVELRNGLHPQSLRALKPSQQWEVVIDESGKVFGASAQQLSAADNTLGRVVALVMPQGHQLPPCVSHATELSDQAIEEILHRIIKSPCGVLGATAQRDLKGDNWMTAIARLTRWAILMLPIANGEPTRVKVMIENRADYEEGTSLKAWQESLESELKLIAPERFAQLHLSIEIVAKDYPYNGYVDAIANCWGSNATVKRQLLARTGWSNHCLLPPTPSLERVENLYANLSADHEITPSDWFDVCDKASKESEHSLLKEVLRELGAKVQHNNCLWREYLQEVIARIQTKKFNTHALNEALLWLANYRPEAEVLSKHLQLQLGAAQLAVNNHLGITDVEQVKQLLALAHELKAEDARLACETLLRVTVSGTNSFDFDSAKPFIESWLQADPIAVPGLLNYAKLHSTLGQLAAFKGQHQSAIDYFDQALSLFKQLSDPEQAMRESEQTDIYRAIALLDAGHESALATVQSIIEAASEKNGLDAVKRIAASGVPLRFKHFLLLRTLVMHPELEEQRAEYLAQQDSWQTDEHHPWMLINAYRAWLLQQAGQLEAAEEAMQQAVDLCLEPNQGLVLRIMSLSLAALGQSLGLDIYTSQPKQGLSTQQEADLEQLATATNDAERISSLQALLPFNFH